MDLSEVISYIPDTTKRALKQSMRENKFKQRWFPKTFSRAFTVDSTVDSVWTTKDTTVEVRLREILTGDATITTDSVARLRNPDTIIGGMHFQIFDTFFSPQETTITVPVTATCDRELFLVPMNNGVEDTIEPRRMAGEAHQGRISGAGPDVSSATAPFLGAMQFVTTSGRRDTFVLRPDTLHRGVQRLYSKDSLLTYTVGESIDVVLSATAIFGQLWWDPPDMVAFLHIGSARRNLRITQPATSLVFGAGDVGMKQIYIEIVRRDPLTEKTDNFTSCMWAIPMRVVAAP